MAQEISHFEKFARAYLAVLAPTDTQHMLLAQIATARLAIEQTRDVIGALAEAQTRQPELLDAVRESSAITMRRIEEEASDPELALLHWEAARGLALSALLGLCPLSDDGRDRLFDRLREETQKAQNGQTWLRW